MSNRLERLLFHLPPPLLKSETRCRLLRRWGTKVGTEVSISRFSKFLYPSNIKIGDDTVIGSATLQAWTTISIGSHVIISDGAQLLTGNHNLHSPYFEGKVLPIEIEDYAWIATNAIVLAGVRVGRGGVVGAGAVVRENVPPLGIVIGNPAQLVGFRRCSDFDYHPGRHSSQYS
ncbi:MAG TPA: hypothetical protein V6D50_13120 [Chroococcales cyanobacterium]|jgi:maltose O-acetyltransferase